MIKGYWVCTLTITLMLLPVFLWANDPQHCLVEYQLSSGILACITQTSTTEVIDHLPPEIDTSTLSDEMLAGFLLGNYHIDTYRLEIQQGGTAQAPWSIDIRTHEMLYPHTYPRLRMIDVLEVESNIFIFYVNALYLNVQVLKKNSNNQWVKDQLLENLTINTQDNFINSASVKQNNDNISFDFSATFNTGTRETWHYIPGQGATLTFGG